jgi:DNA-binding winged helix-turn-helix (wHTH) protein/tetratricopeptide (TPR) repeat protein
MAVVRFGVFELDGDAGELRRHGRLVHLTGQPLKALQLLVDRAGTIVTREELRRHIWDDGRVVDYDRGLNFCIAAVREALGDRARSPGFIETVPRRGYRFIADVKPATRTWPLEAGNRQPETDTRQPARRWFWAAVIPLLLLQVPAPNPAHTRVTTTAAARSVFEQGFADLADGSDGRRRSLARFHEATRLDPRFAEAHFALASVYLDLAGDRELPATAALALARTEALRAIALEDVPDTRKILGVVRLVNDWDWPGARREFVRSLAAEPDSDSTLAAYARYLSAAGEPDRAIEMIDRAEAISPTCDLGLWESALIRYRARRPAEALEKAHAAQQFANHDWTSKVAWLSMLIHVDRSDWALAAAEARTLGAAIEPTRTAVLAFLRARADGAARADGMDRRPVWTATLYAAAGSTEDALNWLEQAAAERDPDLPFGLRDPAFDALRSNERYERLAAEIRFPPGSDLAPQGKSRTRVSVRDGPLRAISPLEFVRPGSDPGRQLFVVEELRGGVRAAEGAREDVIAQREAAVAVGEIHEAALGRQCDGDVILEPAVVPPVPGDAAHRALFETPAEPPREIRRSLGALARRAHHAAFQLHLRRQHHPRGRGLQALAAESRHDEAGVIRRRRDEAGGGVRCGR